MLKMTSLPAQYAFDFEMSADDAIAFANQLLNGAALAKQQGEHKFSIDSTYIDRTGRAFDERFVNVTVKKESDAN